MNIKKNNRELKELNEIFSKIDKGTPDECNKANIELYNLVEKTDYYTILCIISTHSKNQEILNNVLKRSRYFNESVEEIVAMNYAENRYANPLELDRMARNEYPLIVKIGIVGNPTAYDSTIHFLATDSIDKELRRFAEAEKRRRKRNKDKLTTYNLLRNESL